MWNDYSKSYLKNNRASSISIMAAAFAAAMFLSLLCSIAYNFWAYDVERIVLEEGGWQGRIVCETIGSDDLSEDNLLSLICQFANVEKAVINEELSQKGKTAADIYFKNARMIYRDMPLIAAHLGLNEDSIQYNALLLSRFFIHDPEDESPPMLLTLYLVILMIAAVSLILIIRGSFELSMNARIHQFGIFSSIGAAPRQIRTCLLQEAMVLSTLPMLLGSMSGVFISYGVIKAVNFFAADVSGRREAAFQYHPSIFAVAVFLSFLTVIFSAWIPARKLSRMTPLEAIRNTNSLALTKKKHSRFLSFLFGIKGELAGNALKARKKHLRISSISLLLSFLGFSIMLCFTALADISTRFTYFERYQDVWDIMITVKDTEIWDFGLTDELQDSSGIEDAAVYQKAEGMTFLPEGLLSDELSSLGGFEAVSGTPSENGQFQVSAPVVVLDDASFLNFCSQIGIAPGLDGAIVFNQIWDSINSNFRYKKYVPFVREDNQKTVFYKDGKTVEIPVLSYTQTVPALREKYDNYALVHFIPLTMWNKTLGQVCEGEFARYMSIGLTPREMWKMFWIEALVTAGKPLLITLPLTVLFVQFAVTASYLDPMAFWSEAPVLPIVIFAAGIILFVALAYYIGGKRLLQGDLSETLRNDALI